MSQFCHPGYEYSYLAAMIRPSAASGYDRVLTPGDTRQPLSTLKMVFVGACLLVLAIVVILIALPIPSYLTYTVRSKPHQTTWVKDGVSITLEDTEAQYPLILQPTPALKRPLSDWIEENKKYVHQLQIQYGALVFRSFDVSTPQSFEIIARLLAGRLHEHYLGTSPRDRINATRAVHTASGFPAWRPIPAHLEMSFLPSPPERILFWVKSTQPPPGGETPLVDFRKVYRDMDPTVRDRFSTVRYQRLYPSIHTPTSWFWPDPLRTKSWQELFGDRETAKKMCVTINATCVWDDRDEMRVISDGPVVRTLSNGDKVWSNHVNVLHAAATYQEFAMASQHYDQTLAGYWLSWFNRLNYWVFRAWIDSTEALWGSYNLGQHAFHANHTTEIPISRFDVAHIRTISRRHSRIAPHQLHDIIALDNTRIGHAREPYLYGGRRLLVAWGDSP